MDISTSSQNHKTEDILDLYKVKVEKHQSPVNLNIPTELLAFPVFLDVGKNRPTDPDGIFVHIFTYFLEEPICGQWFMVVGLCRMAKKVAPPCHITGSLNIQKYEKWFQMTTGWIRDR